MDKFQKLKTEGEIRKWIDYNAPNSIEEKLLELITDFLGEDGVDLYREYMDLSNDPKMKSVFNGQRDWNVSGTNALANLTLTALDRIKLD